MSYIYIYKRKCLEPIQIKIPIKITKKKKKKILDLHEGQGC